MRLVSHAYSSVCALLTYHGTEIKGMPVSGKPVRSTAQVLQGLKDVCVDDVNAVISREQYDRDSMRTLVSAHC